MTCIVALKSSDNTVTLGIDSAGTVCGSTFVASPSVKSVFTLEVKAYFQQDPMQMAVACTGDFRPQQLLKYRFTPPELGSEDVLKYLVKDFIPAVQQCFKDAGHEKIDNNLETFESNLVIGFLGRVFVVYPGYQVVEWQYRYFAEGSGWQYALGVFHVLETETGSSLVEPSLATRNCCAALEAAARFCNTVCEPFHYVTV